MENRSKSLPLPALLSRVGSISNESQGSVSTATMIMSVNEEDEDFLSNSNAQILKRKRTRMNSDLILRRNRSVLSEDRNIDHSLNSRRLSRNRSVDLDLLTSSIRSCDKRKGVSNSSCHQLAVIVALAEIDGSKSPIFLNCLDIAATVMYHQSKRNSETTPCSSAQNVESFCAVFSASEPNNSFTYRHSSEFVSPKSAMETLQDHLLTNMNATKKENSDSGQSSKSSETNFQQLEATILNLCNTLPWTHSLALDKQQTTKSIHIILPNPSQYSLNTPTSSVKRQLNSLKTHLLEQPAGGINLYFIDASSNLNESHLPHKAVSSSQTLIPSSNIVPCLNLKDLYSYTSQFLSGNYKTPIHLKEDLVAISPPNTMHSLHLEIMESSKNKTNNPPQDIQTNLDHTQNLSHFSCTCFPLFHPHVVHNITNNTESLHSVPLLPSRLGLPQIISLSDLRRYSDSDIDKSIFLVCSPFYNKATENSENLSIKDSKSNVPGDFEKLIMILRLSKSALIFFNQHDCSSKEGGDCSSFLLTPLSPFTASLQVISSNDYSLYKTKMYPFERMDASSLLENPPTALLPYEIPNVTRIHDKSKIQNLLHMLSMTRLAVCKDCDDLKEKQFPSPELKERSTKKQKTSHESKNNDVNVLPQDIIKITKENNTNKIQENSFVPKENESLANNEEIATVSKEANKIASSKFSPPKELNIPLSSANRYINPERFLSFYENCVDTNEPTPIELVRNYLLPIKHFGKNIKTSIRDKIPLKSDDDMKERERIISTCRTLLLSTADITTGSNEDDETEKRCKLRRIQIQILLRMQLLVVTGEYILDPRNDSKDASEKGSTYKKLKKKKNKSNKRKDKNDKKAVNESQFVEYIESLLSLVRFSLPASIDFVTIFNENIVSPFIDSVPHIVGDISDSFDIVIPSKSAATPSMKTSDGLKTDTDKPISKLSRTSSISKKFSFLTSVSEEEKYTKTESDVKESSMEFGSVPTKQNSFSRTTSIASSTSESSNKHFSVQSLIKRSGSLQRRNSSRNPLLADGKKTYLGSHFNTKLSNMSSLFRQTKLVRRVSQNARNQSTNQILQKSDASETNFDATKRAGSLNKQNIASPTNRTSFIKKNQNQFIHSQLSSPPRSSLRRTRVVSETPTKDSAMTKKDLNTNLQENHRSTANLVAAAAFAARKYKSNNIK